MKKILLFRHEDWIRAPHLTDALDELSIPHQLIRIDMDDEIPKNIADDVAGLAFYGGTMSVNDPLDWIDKECDLIREAMKKDIPVLGHCLGSQLISKSLGGTIKPMDRKEIGWHKIKFLDNEVAQEWKAHIKDGTEILLWHHDEFSLPAGATPLYTTANCKNQAFVIGKALGTVAHIECSNPMLNEWLEVYGHDVDANGSSVQSIEQMKDDMESKMKSMHILTDHFYHKWLKLVFPKNEYPQLFASIENHFSAKPTG